LTLSARWLLNAGVRWRGDGAVVVPYRRPDRTTFRCKVFPASGGSYWGPGEGLLPFGLEQLRQPPERDGRLLWIAEGESDCLALRENYAAWRDYPVDALGLPGAGTWRAEWARHLAGYRGVYVFPDGDQAGERMATAITASVRWAVVTYLPAGEDVRGLVQSRGPGELDRHIVEAERVALLYAALVLNPTVARAKAWLAEVVL
jgi:DNA primase